MTSQIQFSLPYSTFGSMDFTLESPITLNDDVAKNIVESLKEHKKLPTAEFFDCHRWDFDYKNDKILREMILASRNAEQHCRENNDIAVFAEVNREYVASILEKHSVNYCSQEEFYRNSVREEIDGLGDGDFIERLTDEGLIVIEEEGDFEETLLEMLTKAVHEADDSSISDLFGGRNYIMELIYSPTLDWDNCEPSSSNSFVEVDSDGSFTTQGVLELLMMANVSSGELKQHIKDKGYDLYDGERESIEKLEFEADPSKKKVSTAELVWATINNASNGGIPAFTCYVNVNELLNRDVTKEITFDRGVLGLEDTVYGSGHNETIVGNFTMPIGANNWYVLSREQALDNVYLFASQALKSSINQ
ncbi:hypothetical protein [Vibrio sp. D431a]|uniref:hypothetical protein n=1 Tax=Vibrio sp. D431a TaxID=2837388 RepID=UPI00255235CE|nr:hypothetical protein [Vibrio sp. D431a]MDK9793301.1 hypothetical protein [Vibrio sp. D431a]